MQPTLPDRFTFDLTLARDYGWPIVTDDGFYQVERVLCFDAPEAYPILFAIKGRNKIGYLKYEQARLSADLTNPAVQKAVAAAHAAAHAAGEPISFFNNNIGAWTSCKGDTPHWTWRVWPYLPTRLLSKLPKPAPAWTLPPPPKGAQWHRTDGWTADMLPEGCRSLLLGESPLKGDEINHDECLQSRWTVFGSTGSPVRADEVNWFYRTRRPLPPEHRIAEATCPHTPPSSGSASSLPSTPSRGSCCGSSPLFSESHTKNQ